MLAKGQTIIQWMEKLAPKSLAVPDDRIGLQLGSLQGEINNVLITLDVTEAVVEEAIQIGAKLIIAHHAIIFRPLKDLQTDTPAGRLYEKLIKHDIAVYISHTNYDIAEGGMNDLMADALRLQHVKVLEKLQQEKLQKLVVFVPKSHAEQVRTAILDTGAGWIGDYSHCSFNLEGIGTFKPLEGTNPFIGTTGKVEEVEEVRMETIIPSSVKSRVLRAMLKAHPYEEVAYDLYPVELEGKVYGLGRVGKLTEAVTLSELAEQVKTQFNVPFVRVVGPLDREVSKVAVLGGSGSRYVKHALFHGADVLVTGDIDYHTAHDALAAGLCIIDPGHNAEKMMKDSVAARLQAIANEQRSDTKFHSSGIATEVFQML
ncbi:Nif3-like dinuclear metal center hexameric protein [Paenibacillus sp. UMB4589-SE434]|uniref:Nif3-like dinuclear metal center hexameric protein n=1 Tax=Paenibacillus sp. UMB4589-SE434 TaxID=3046314 RepID=UPI00254CA09E|nr:Nif3-like dinuclear metal center hexameric protein [Paenibacillus sp. UMB4589-SE434]MDK8180975.1 Nif3-like dinuclear metal center hexameric protein [Paenibacillus sp. UMB4589-SE434]